MGTSSFFRILCERIMYHCVVMTFVYDPVATKKDFPCSLQRHGPVHSLGSEDQKDRK